MKIHETILLSFIVFFFAVGVHQAFINGFLESYWIFMLVVVLLSIYKLTKSKPDNSETK